jgi:hypothetical protein
LTLPLRLQGHRQPRAQLANAINGLTFEIEAREDIKSVSICDCIARGT